MQNFREIGPVVFEKNGNEQTDKEKYNIDSYLWIIVMYAGCFLVTIVTDNLSIRKTKTYLNCCHAVKIFCMIRIYGH